jgi:hypothetical protein
LFLFFSKNNFAAAEIPTDQFYVMSLLCLYIHFIKLASGAFRLIKIL